jgi:hypothetical protein
MTAWPLKNVVTDPNLPDALANLPLTHGSEERSLEVAEDLQK